MLALGWRNFTIAAGQFYAHLHQTSQGNINILGERQITINSINNTQMTTIRFSGISILYVKNSLYFQSLKYTCRKRARHNTNVSVYGQFV